MRKLPIRHAGSPLVTNAHINRQHAYTCFRAGMSAVDIAAQWPEVFTTTIEDGVAKLSQKYDYELADGSGRFETRRLITKTSVAQALRSFRRRGGR